MLSEKLVCFTAVFLLILIGAASHAAAATNSSQAGISGNLLVNPAWENGTSGWETIAINQKGSFEEGELSVSAVCQDIPIEESMAGKALKLSGNISVSPADPETETDDIETGRTGTDDTGWLNENEIRYMQDGSVMYNGHRYKIIQEAMYWEDAWDYCVELGGYLVTITSAQEQALMEKILKDSDAHGKFMIGLGSLDRDLRNAFEWITREPLEYTNWGEGEPDGGQPVCILSTEDISGSHFHIRPYQWDDDNYNPYFFICEWDPETDAVG